MSSEEKIKRVGVFRIIGKIVEDKTCYGNRFHIQCEDTSVENYSFLRPLVGKEIEMMIQFEDEKC